MATTTNWGQVVQEVCSALHVTPQRDLGSGAHKRAFLVSGADGNYVALKIAPVTDSLEARFAREASALIQCQHEAIARLLKVERYEISGAKYWVMLEEFLSGGTLDAFKSATPADISTIKHVGRILAGAIGHLKDRGFVHRDIKPANILFRTPADPVLTDFGIVRILGEPSLTHDFMMQGPGTPYYAAPEQLLNEKFLIDWRTDQFCLAVVLAEWILGRHPFAPDALDKQAAVIAVAQRAPLPIEARKQLQERGAAGLVQALAPWPVARYRHPTDFIGALA